jgi:MFS family permease
VKNKQAITLLFLANIISGLAQGISMVAIPWYFVKVVARPEVFANAYFLITFITLFWGIYAGTLVDRYSRRNLFIIINVICGLFIGSVAVFGIQDKEVWSPLLLPSPMSSLIIWSIKSCKFMFWFLFFIAKIRKILVVKKHD